jgi:hypothetical protein
MFVPTWVRIWVPPPQEAEQAAQGPHSREEGQDVPLQDLDCFLTQVPVLPFLSHWTFLLLSVVPVPQDTEQLDQLLHGSDAGRAGAVGRTQLGGFSVSFMKTNGEPSVSTNTNANLAAELMLIR